MFGTRSADRPNPIGLHRVQIVTVDDTRLHVRNLEAVDGTPIVDIKPSSAPPTSADIARPAESERSL